MRVALLAGYSNALAFAIWSAATGVYIHRGDVVLAVIGAAVAAFHLFTSITMFRVYAVTKPKNPPQGESSKE